MLFLWNSSNPSSNLILLEFYDSSSGRIEKFETTQYKPYFLSAYPLSRNEKEAVEAIQGEVERVEKRNLFTNERVQMAKVKVWTPKLLKKLEKQFKNVWETQIEYSQSYVYDNSLVFGVPYTQHNGKFLMAIDVQQSWKRKFEKVFTREKGASPLKYAQIEEWFNICNQPVPNVDFEMLGIDTKAENTAEKTYLTFLLARIANIPLPKAYNSRRVSDWIKSMIFTYMRRNDVLVPTSKQLRRGSEIHRVPGALTMKPQAGTYFNMLVCDFQSLYPSCIDSYNLSYETVDCPHKECQVNRIPETKHHVCVRRRGFYSILIGALKDLRIRWFKPLSTNMSVPEEKTRLARAASKLLKLISVSSYGVTVRIHGVACPPLAESITACGRNALQTTWRIAEENGMHPTYGDTDSIFLDNPSPRQVEVLIGTVKKSLNLDLIVEKQYAICVLPQARKAYFGIAEDGTAELKGLTAAKSNAPRFIRQVFLDCVKVLSHVRNRGQYVSAKKEIVAIAHQAQKKLRGRKVNLDELVYSVQLYYDPHEKTVATGVLPQPYQCALQLIDAGKKLGRRDTVHFVKVKPFNYKGRTFTVKPVDQVKGLVEVNVEDYLRNLTTALEQTFKPMEIELKEHTETKLTGWFEV